MLFLGAGHLHHQEAKQDLANIGNEMARLFDEKILRPLPITVIQFGEIAGTFIDHLFKYHHSYLCVS